MICVTLEVSTGGSLTNLEKTWKPGRADVDVLGADALFGEQLLKRLLHDAFAGGFLGALRAERLEAVLLQAQTARFVDFELGQLETARPEINRQK